MKKEICIWGTGIDAEFFFDVIKASNLICKYFVETAPQRKELHNVPIISAGEWLQSETTVVVVNSFSEEIYDWCKKNDADFSKIIFIMKEKVHAVCRDKSIEFDLHNKKNWESWISMSSHNITTNSSEIFETLIGFQKFSLHWDEVEIYNPEVIFPELAENQKRMLKEKFFPNLKSEDKLFDLACGSGFYTELFSSNVASVDAFDYSERLIETAIKTAKEKGIQNINYYCVDAKMIEFPNCYDAGVMMSLLLYLWDDKDALTVIHKMHDALKPNALLFVKDSVNTMHENRTFTFDYCNGYKGCYRGREDYLNLFLDNGFELLDEQILSQLDLGKMLKASTGFIFRCV